METTYYLSAYARKLERRGLGYEAATNAYCALSWLHRSALRGCEEARLACGCCLASGGARGHHSLHIWSGPASCYSQDLHDVPAQAMAYFEPAPEYLLDDKDGVRRYVRAYDQCMEMSREYLSLVDAQRRSWHESFTGRADRPSCCGWNQSTGSVKVVRIDFSGYDVRRHVERLVSDMDADIREAERRMKLDHERERRESEECLRERAREVNRRNATSPAAPL